MVSQPSVNSSFSKGGGESASRRILKSLHSSEAGAPFRKGRIPDTPGVYFFLGRPRSGLASDGTHPKPAGAGRVQKVLYIGRATSLRNRVRSYFAPDIARKRSQWIEKMIEEAKSVDFKRTDSVLEAILLEADLIKKFKPPYNTDLKDDRSFNCVVLTEEDFPAVLLARQKDIDFSSLRIKDKGLRISAVYGPFPDGFQLQAAMKIIRKIFPYRDAKCVPCSEQKRPHQAHTDKLEFVSMCRPCFNLQIGLCPGVCTGEVSTEEYAKTIRNLRLFFEGRKTRLLKLLQKEMKTAARRQEFEKAGELKRQLFALRHIQDIALLRSADYRRFEDADARRYESSSATISGAISEHQRFRVEAYDLSHFGGKEIVGAMAVVEDGIAKPSEYRLFKLRGITTQNEVAGLQEILRRRFNHPEWPFPELIVVDGNEVQKKAAETVLSGLGQQIPVVAVVKDEHHRPRALLGTGPARHLRSSAFLHLRESAVLLANSEAHRFVLKFQRKRRRKILQKKSTVA